MSGSRGADGWPDGIQVVRGAPDEVELAAAVVALLAAVSRRGRAAGTGPVPARTRWSHPTAVMTPNAVERGDGAWRRGHWH